MAMILFLIQLLVMVPVYYKIYSNLPLKIIPRLIAYTGIIVFISIAGGFLGGIVG